MERHTDQSRERIAQLAATCVCSNLRRTARAVSNYYDGLLGEISDLRISQVVVLVVLYLAGAQTINELAERLALDRTTLARNLKPLTQQKLLTVAAGKDQRTRIVTLTAEGEETLLRVLPVWEQAQAEVVAGIGDEQVVPFLAQLQQVAARTHSA